MISYADLRMIPNEVICLNDFEIDQSLSCDISFPINVRYNFKALFWVDGDTDERVYIPWQNNTLPPYYPKEYNQVALYYAKDLSDTKTYRLPPRFILWSDECEEFKRGYKAELEKDLEFLDRYFLESQYNASISAGNELFLFFILTKSVCANSVKFWCVKDEQLMGPYKDGNSEALEKCTLLDASIWTPRGNITKNLFDTSEMIWTGSTRLNRTHLIREDGHVFKPEIFHFEETPGFSAFSSEARGISVQDPSHTKSLE